MSDEEDDSCSSPEEGFSASEDDWKPGKEVRGGESSDDDDSDFECLPNETAALGATANKKSSVLKGRGGAVGKSSAIKKRKSTQSLRTKLYNKYKPPPKTVVRSDSNSPSACTSKNLNTASKNAVAPNDNSDNENSSASSVDDYLVNPAELDLQSSFFNVGSQKITNVAATATSSSPHFDCNAGMNLSLDSDSEDNNESSADDIARSGGGEGGGKAFDFHNLLEKANKLESVKESIAKRASIAKADQEVTALPKRESAAMDVESLLALGENQNIQSSIDPKMERQKLRQTKSTRHKRQTKTRTAATAADSEDSDWEEVADEIGSSDVEDAAAGSGAQNKDLTRIESLEIHVELPNKQRSKKKRNQDEIEAMLKRKLNREIKERQLLLHKSSLLCCFARSYLYNRLLNDAELMKEALKLLPSKNSYPPERGTELKYYQSMVTWFKTVIQLKSDSFYAANGLMKTNKKVLKDHLLEEIRKKEACCKQDMIFIFIILIRGMGLQCRLVVNMQPFPLRPAQTELCTIKLKNKKQDENEDSEKKAASKAEDNKTTIKDTKDQMEKKGTKSKGDAHQNAGKKKGKSNEATKDIREENKELNNKKSTKDKKVETKQKPKDSNDKDNNGNSNKLTEMKEKREKLSRTNTSKKKLKDGTDELPLKRSSEIVENNARKEKQRRNTEPSQHVDKALEKREKTTRLKLNKLHHDKGDQIVDERRADDEEVTKSQESKEGSWPIEVSAKDAAVITMNVNENNGDQSIPNIRDACERHDYTVEIANPDIALSEAPANQVTSNELRQSSKPALAKLQRNRKTPLTVTDSKRLKLTEDCSTPIARRTRRASSDRRNLEQQRPSIEIGSPVLPTIVLPTNQRAIRTTNDDVPASSNIRPRRSRSKSPKCYVSPEFLQTKIFREKFINNNNNEAPTTNNAAGKQRAKSKSPVNDKIKISPEFLHKGNSALSESPPKERRVLRSRHLKVPQLDGADDDFIMNNAEVVRTKGAQRPQLRKLKKATNPHPEHATDDNESIEEDADFEPSPPKRPKKAPLPKPLERLRKDRRVLSTDDDDNNEAAAGVRCNKSSLAADIWVEVWSDVEDSWICVDLFKGKLNSVEAIRKSASSSLVYVFAFQNDLSIKDITARYCTHWSTAVRKSRVDKAWLDAAIGRYVNRHRTKRDICEDVELRRIHEEKPMPTSICDYKDHPLYALERHLLKFQAIYPADAPTLGFVRGEPVYARECVHTLHSREIWLKQARTVKLGEQPYKIVKARPKWDRLTQSVIKDQPLEIFGYWQTEDYEPPTAENGLVPRNAYGNVELFKARMLPKKTVHLKLPGLNRICKKLGIDCANAVIGFDFHQGSCHPTYDGFVVCEEYADQVTAAWHQDQEDQERKELEKYETRVYGNWKKLVRGLLIRERLKKKYNF